MAAPSLISTTTAIANGGGVDRVTAAIAVQAGDRLVAFGLCHNNATIAIASSPSLTWTEQESIYQSGKATIKIWTADPASSTNYTVTFTTQYSNTLGGGQVHVWRGSSGYGAAESGIGTGDPSLNITTLGANSALCVLVSDDNARDDDGRTWATSAGTFTETLNMLDSPTACYGTGGYHADAGAAGAKTVGLSGTLSQNYAIAAIEVRGASAATAMPVFLHQYRQRSA